MYFKQTILDLINNNIRNKFPKVIKAEHAQIEEALLDSIFLPYEVKQLDCPQEFLEENFNLTPGPTMGLGKNLALGYAICNGNNGTQNRNGRVALQYDPEQYPNLGDTGGSNDAVVVAHTHNIATSPNDSLGYVTVKASSSTGGTSISTTVAGESGIGKNRQPFIVSLFIQRVQPIQ